MEHIRFWASPITLRHMDKMACGSTGTQIMRDCRNKFQVEKKCIPDNVCTLYD